MRPDIENTCHAIDTTNWKEIPIDYGAEILKVRVPPDCAIIGMKEIPVLPDLRAAFEEALSIYKAAA